MNIIKTRRYMIYIITCYLKDVWITHRWCLIGIGLQIPQIEKKNTFHYFFTRYTYLLFQILNTLIIIIIIIYLFLKSLINLRIFNWVPDKFCCLLSTK